eukprot:m.116581 g.116581  ORF g.116581 m.116581 type:complete len:329 (+) comp14469_c0_seq1:1132-2118(+)
MSAPEISINAAAFPGFDDAPIDPGIVPQRVDLSFEEQFQRDYSYDPFPTNSASRALVYLRRGTTERFVVKSLLNNPEAQEEVRIHRLLADADKNENIQTQQHIIPIIATFEVTLPVGHELRPAIANESNSPYHQQPAPVILLVTPKMNHSLHSFYSEHRPLSPDLVHHILVQTRRAVSYVHSKGYAHSDIKPANFVIDVERMHVYLIDFGQTHANNTTLNSMFGTSLFLPPEVLFAFQQHQPSETSPTIQLHESSDVWAVGVSVYFLLFGELPFGENPRKVLERQYSDYLRVMDRLESHPTLRAMPDLFHFVANALRWNPSERLLHDI